MHSIDLGGRRFHLARAVASEVPALAALLADDVLGSQRESSNLEPYLAAFREIDADPNQLLVGARMPAASTRGSDTSPATRASSCPSESTSTQGTGHLARARPVC
ncbi:MAG TPA: hypothetical protein VFR99_03520 [Marmoricola sp.]|nr:hypothetical protein [Marmoricola sp.]